MSPIHTIDIDILDESFGLSLLICLSKLFGKPHPERFFYTEIKKLGSIHSQFSFSEGLHYIKAQLLSRTWEKRVNLGNVIFILSYALTHNLWIESNLLFILVRPRSVWDIASLHMVEHLSAENRIITTDISYNWFSILFWIWRNILK